MFKTVGVCGFVIWAGCLFLSNLAYAQTDECLDLRSQTEMNNCEADRYSKADADLNVTYQKLLSKHKSDTKFIAKLRFAQQAWLKYRDAYLDSIYYAQDKQQAYGSVYPTCKNILLTRLTLERTKELSAMLNPEEGDVCGFAASETSSGGGSAKPD